MCTRGCESASGGSGEKERKTEAKKKEVEVESETSATEKKIEKNRQILLYPLHSSLNPSACFCCGRVQLNNASIYRLKVSLSKKKAALTLALNARMRAAPIPSTEEDDDEDAEMIASEAASKSMAARLGMNLSYCCR